ncbi:hypothetical protein HY412_01535 [Candidatus Kaiserbacteria bacterium]|nr:hypothetical protein [Candidatus Kaiserbacteria bacterium]
MEYLTPVAVTWVVLSVFAGGVDALGQLLCKNAWRPPPYVIVGFLGIMWLVGPVILMSVGPATIGTHTVMTFGQAASLGTGVILAALVVGVMFWFDNLTRFDANNKAPFVGYVLVLVEISAMLTAFSIELVLKANRGDVIAVDLYQLGGVLLALGSAALFYGGKIVEEKKQKSVQKEEGKKFEPFIPLSWVTLAVITGVLSALGNLLYKESAGSAMPPYVFAGIIGFVWVACSVVFIGKRQTWRRIGLRLPVLSFRETTNFGPVVIFSLLLAGVLTWLANLARFDAVNKAPFVGYTFLIIPIAACVVALVLEICVKWFQGKDVAISQYEIGGIILATWAIALFAISTVPTS